ncbi:MAG: pyridoxamine 5'-phosphate oxidase family protein [Neomegalonema sp.]|nr:pyridoxamine 5'-phosphate oxidase family protein [Neomegalonema sp.]
MGHRYTEIAFTDAVKAMQTTRGSRNGYAKRQERPGETNHALGLDEQAFIASRDSFYIASISETGWPYLQHRGGPPGFLHVLDDKTVSFADFAGNRQYISVGNLQGDDRVSLFLIDYPRRARLKIYGRARTIEATDALDRESQALFDRLTPVGYDARIERAFVIKIEAFDWNCPQHITPRYTAEDIQRAVAPLHTRIEELENALGASEASKHAG